MTTREIKNQTDEIYNHLYSKITVTSNDYRVECIKATAEIMKALIIANTIEKIKGI